MAALARREFFRGGEAGGGLTSIFGGFVMDSWNWRGSAALVGGGGRRGFKSWEMGEEDGDAGMESRKLGGSKQGRSGNGSTWYTEYKMEEFLGRFL